MAAPLPQPIDILVARNRIGDAARRTPLQSSATLAEASGAAEVRMKLEHLQNTGSFKIRGAWNKVAAVAEVDPRAAIANIDGSGRARLGAVGTALAALRRIDPWKASVALRKRRRLRIGELHRPIALPKPSADDVDHANRPRGCNSRFTDRVRSRRG